MTPIEGIGLSYLLWPSHNRFAQPVDRVADRAFDIA